MLVDLHDLQLEDEGEEEEESEEESEATVPVRDDAKLCVAAHKGDECRITPAILSLVIKSTCKLSIILL